MQQLQQLRGLGRDRCITPHSHVHGYYIHNYSAHALNHTMHSPLSRLHCGSSLYTIHTVDNVMISCSKPLGETLAVFDVMCTTLEIYRSYI